MEYPNMVFFGENFDYDVKYDEIEAQCDQIDRMSPDIKIHLCKPSVFTNCS